MRILAISTWFPYPPDNGSKMRAYNLLRHLGRVHDLDIIAMSQSRKDLDYMDEVRAFSRRAAVFPEPSFNPGRVSSWSGFLSPIPRYFREHHSAQLETVSQEWSDNGEYDAVVAVTLGAAPYAAKAKALFKILDHHNVEYQVIRRQCQVERSLLRRLRYTPTWIKAAKFEKAVTGVFDAIAVVSSCERTLMEDLLPHESRITHHELRITVVPNGVDPGLLEFNAPKKQNTLVFTGALSYRPNYDAALALCKDILPAIRRQFPDVRLRITGRNDGVDMTKFPQDRGIEFTGYVDDIRPVVASASALVVPLRFGGGTRLKILEAMALGTPVVSTPMGAEGLEIENGVHMLLGESSGDLVSQTARILSDPEFGEWIAKNARALIREKYQWPAIAEDFERVISSGLERKRNGH